MFFQNPELIRWWSQPTLPPCVRRSYRTASVLQVCSARNLWQLVLPHLGLGLGVGAVDAALVPLLAYLVDTRHGAGYGAVYALQQTAVSLAYALGKS